VLLNLWTHLHHHRAELCSVPQAQLHNTPKSVLQSVNSINRYNWRASLA